MTCIPLWLIQVQQVSFGLLIHTMHNISTRHFLILDDRSKKSSTSNCDGPNCFLTLSKKFGQPIKRLLVSFNDTILMRHPLNATQWSSTDWHLSWVKIEKFLYFECPSTRISPWKPWSFEFHWSNYGVQLSNFLVNKSILNLLSHDRMYSFKPRHRHSRRFGWLVLKLLSKI